MQMPFSHDAIAKSQGICTGASNEILTLNFKIEIGLRLGWLAAITKIRYAEIKKTGIVKRIQKQISNFERIPEESKFSNSLIMNVEI